MLYYDNNEWKICKFKVIYTRGGSQEEQFVGQEGNRWWKDFAKNWDDMEIVEFVNVTTTDTQIARLGQVNDLNISDGHSTVLADYVLRGAFPAKANHILKDLQNKVNRELDMDYLIDLDFRISMAEMGM